MKAKDKINLALSIANRYGQTDGAHHKAWVIDQMVRALLQCPILTLTGIDANGDGYSHEYFGESRKYLDFVKFHLAGEDGENTYAWDIGVAP